MTNELLFLLQIIFVSTMTLGALALGKEALVTSISLLLVVANLFVIKQITLFGLDVTSADVFVIGAVFGCNLLQEYFGASIAKKTIWISFFVSAGVVVLSQIHLRYLPNMHDISQHSFATILGFLPRFFVASCIAYVCAQYLRLFLYSLLKRMFQSRYFVTRNVVVTVLEQALDTLLFTLIGLYGIVYSVSDIFLLSFAVKMIAIICTAPSVLVSRLIMRRL